MYRGRELDLHRFSLYVIWNLFNAIFFLTILFVYRSLSLKKIFARNSAV